MRQAVATRYIGPTNHRGTRVVAHCDAGKLTVAWDYELDVEANHRAAALALITQLGWSGHWHGGSMHSGYVWTWSPDSNVADFVTDFGPHTRPLPSLGRS